MGRGDKRHSMKMKRRVARRKKKERIKRRIERVRAERGKAES